jgi:hypothetical protein
MGIHKLSISKQAGTKVLDSREHKAKENPTLLPVAV